MQNIIGNTVEIALDPGSTRQRLRMHFCGGKDLVASIVACGDWKSFEPPMPEVFFHLAQECTGIVVDVGANTGFYALLAGAANPKVKILAFEPDPTVIPILRKNVRMNGLYWRVKIYRYGLSDKIGAANLYIPTQEHGLVETSSSLESTFKEAHSKIVPVKVSTMDRILSSWRYASTRVAMIKIDVEGHEASVLRGAENIVRRDRPIIFIEVLPRADITFLTEFLNRNRYKDARLRPDGISSLGSEVYFDERAWNHLLIPDEHAEAVWRRFADR
jgi:FkbM family methyltransferase